MLISGSIKPSRLISGFSYHLIKRSMVQLKIYLPKPCKSVNQYKHESELVYDQIHAWIYSLFNGSRSFNHTAMLFPTQISLIKPSTVQNIFIPGVSINQSVSDSQKTAQIYTSTWIIRVLIQIQDRKIFGTDRDPDRTLKRILIQTKMIRIRIRIQAKKDLLKNAHIPCFVCFYYIFNYHFSINL